MSINKIELKNFKAHQELLINLNNSSNLLLYGNNGAGKSSIFEAIKFSFFKQRIKIEILKDKNFATQIDEDKEIEQYLLNYKNRSTINDFSITLNGGHTETFNNTAIYMIDNSYMKYDFNVEKLLDNLYFTVNLDDIKTNINEIEENVNTLLNEFYENINVNIDSTDFSISINDTLRNINDEKRLNIYFNEAMINLIYIALLFSIIRISKNNYDNNIIVLDDFITSMDEANRTLLLKYLLQNFNDCQIIIFTHNIFFHKLIKYTIDTDTYSTNDNWEFLNLYQTINANSVKSVLYPQDEVTLKKLTDELEKAEENQEDLSNLGNKIRKYFEKQLHKLEKIYYLGTLSSVSIIVRDILNNEQIYLKNKKLLTTIYSKSTIEDVKSEIDNYKYIPSELQQIILEAQFFKKIIMHPNSHENTDIDIQNHNIEFNKTLRILKDIDEHIKVLEGTD